MSEREGARIESPTVEIRSDHKGYWQRFGSLIGVLGFLAVFPFFFERDGQTEGFQIVAFGMALTTFALAFYTRPRTLGLRLDGERVILSRGVGRSEVSLPVSKVHRIQFTPLGHLLGRSLDYLEMGEQNAKKLDCWGPCLVADPVRRKRIEDELERFLVAVREVRRMGG